MPHPDPSNPRSRTWGLSVPGTKATGLDSLISWVLVLIIAGCSQSAFTLPDDSEQAIEIRSNSAVRDDKTGLTIYSGNVDMRQGSMRITGDKVTITLKDNEVSKIVAQGRPAFFSQQPEPGADDIEAKANTIEYNVTKELITLQDQASLKQSDGSTLTSERVFYDVNAARVEAGGDQGQVLTVIQPRAKSTTEK